MPPFAFNPVVIIYIGLEDQMNYTPKPQNVCDFFNSLSIDQIIIRFGSVKAWR